MVVPIESHDVVVVTPEENEGDDDDDEVIDGIEFVDYHDESQLESVMSLVGNDLSEPYSIFTYRFFLHRYPQLCILAVPTKAASSNHHNHRRRRGRQHNDPSSSTNDSIIHPHEEPQSPNSYDHNMEHNVDKQEEEEEEQDYVEDDPIEPVGCVVGKIDMEEVTTMETDDPGCSSSSSSSNSYNTSRHGMVPQSSSASLSSQVVLTGYIGMLAVSETYRRRGIGRALVRRVLRRMRQCHCTSVTLETEASNQVAQSLYQDTFGFVREELLVRYYLNWSDAYRLRLWFTCPNPTNQNNDDDNDEEEANNQISMEPQR